MSYKKQVNIGHQSGNIFKIENQDEYSAKKASNSSQENNISRENL